MKTALLVIDVQQGMCVGEDAAFEVNRVIERINGLSETARAEESPVVFIQHEEAGGAFQYGFEGWQLAATLATDPGDLRVRKKTPDSFNQTELQDLLQSKQVQRLVICGLQSDFCVDTTVRRALSHGYYVTLVADAHSTLDNDILTAAQITAHHNWTFAHMTSFGPRISVIPASEISFGD